jgi:hypothetical protein
VLKRRFALLAGAACVVWLGAVSCEPTNQGYAPDQPIKYSHAVHAGAMQIPCQYCHFSASEGRHAGIPPARICMNCHLQVRPDHPEVAKIKAALDSKQPIAWTKVHNLPDHVYFNHSAHVNNGVACEKCHGVVSSMGRVEQWAPMTMGFCLNCHRQSAPEQGRGGPLTDCAVCHH